MKKNKKYSWKKIWNNRKIELPDHYTVLEKLMLLNGHLLSINKITVKNWINYGKKIQEKINIKNNESIYEFGCGSGALLYLFKEKSNKLYGCDYSKQLVEKSKKLFKEAKILHKDCSKVSTSKKYDHIITSSMLEYVKTSDVEKIIFKMIKKFKKNLFISEVLNEKKKNEFLRVFKKKKNYYNFLDKKFFLKICKKKKLKVKIFPSLLPNSNQKKYRYSVLIKK